MQRQLVSTRRFGVFATLRGWVVVDPEQILEFDTRNDAVGAARKLAHVARWRGAWAEVVAQDTPGGLLQVIDPPSSDGVVTDA
jgi:hypothetical protein